MVDALLEPFSDGFWKRYSAKLTFREFSYV